MLLWNERQRGQKGKLQFLRPTSIIAIPIFSVKRSSMSIAYGRRNKYEYEIKDEYK